MLQKVIGDILLLVSSIVVLKNGGSGYDFWTFTTLAFLCGHALLGLANKIEQRNEAVTQLISISRSLVQLLPLAFVNTSLFLKNGYRPEVAYLHAFSAILPLLMETLLREHDTSGSVKDLVSIGNIVSCLFLALQRDSNSQYAALAITTTINRYFLGSLTDALNLPPEQGLSAGLALFVCCIHLIWNTNRLL